MSTHFIRTYDWSCPLDEMWEAIPQPGWDFSLTPGCARFSNSNAGRAEVHLRSCSGYGEIITLDLVPGAPREGRLLLTFHAGFEYARIEVDLKPGKARCRTSEFHKAQPRAQGNLPAKWHRLCLRREQDALPGLPYEGTRLVLLADEQVVMTVGAIDLLPECLFSFGLEGPGEFSLSAFTLEGPPRPRPEYLQLGIWQQSIKPTTQQNVEALVAGVREAAAAGVEVLITPETSLTGLRPDHPELFDREHIRQAVDYFQRQIASIEGAPYTLVGFPAWIDGSGVEGATLDEVRVNAHHFVRPDGSLGPRMAKVHSCEENLWHGRDYNLQRVAGVEMAVGVCHDAHYADVWFTGAMNGARVAVHALGAGSPANIPELVASLHGKGGELDMFWARVNSGGGSAILYPSANLHQPDDVLAVPRDLTNENPSYPVYQTMGDLLAHTRIRVWDATACYPMRILRSGAARYRLWQQLVPPLLEV